MATYYDILGVSETATAAQIKSAFKKMALRYHPDKNQGDPLMEERFKEINQAYQVLSNPYEKARYDIMSQFGKQPTVPPSYNPPRYDRPMYQPVYTRRQVDHRENWIATAYAFGFTLVVAVMVLTFIGVKQYVNEKRLQERLDGRRALFMEALEAQKQGDLDKTLRLLNSLGLFHERERDIAGFKSGLIDDIVDKSQFYFSHGDYHTAIYYYELIENHTTIQALKIKENMALSYKMTREPEKSVYLFSQLLVLGYRNISTYVELAEIHRDQLHDLATARMYFERANEAAKEYYESVYGKAYAVMIRGDMLSEVHFRLYYGLADIYLQMEDPVRALKVNKWNVQVWPGRAENHVLAARCLQQLGNHAEACAHYHTAVSLNPEVALPSDCR
ncbi:MAG: DnaJ domain-containing protein [Cyclobacteriaceae bacterium]|nr:DnaJ domain-containing protein [Cyclobacteriaceae bacterium]